MKVLIVDPDSVRASTLQLGLATHGVEVTVASTGSFALTMLEWNRHEVVTSRARIGDMDGHELCAILKSDPGTRDVRFVLIAGPSEVTAAQTTAAGVDLVLPPTLQASAIVPLVMRLTHGNTPPASAPPAVAPPPVVAPRPYAPPRPVPPPVSAPTPAVAPATKPTAGPAPAKPAATAPAAAPTAPRTEILVKSPAPARPEPAPAVPKLRPDPVAPPAVEPPKRYVTAAAAAAAAPWTKQPAASGGPAAAPPAPPPPAPAINLDQMPSGTFQGSLQVMDLAELTQALAMGGKNGRLILALPQGGGLIVFEGRRVVHAEYRGATGEAAFAGLLTAAHTGGAGRFCFLPSAAGENPSPSRTINKSVDRLLLGIATAIDEKG